MGKRWESLVCCKDCVLPSKLEIEECSYNEEIANSHFLFAWLIMTTIHLIVLVVQLNYDTCKMILSFSVRNMSMLENMWSSIMILNYNMGYIKICIHQENNTFSRIFVIIRWTMHFIFRPQWTTFILLISTNINKKQNFQSYISILYYFYYVFHFIFLWNIYF